MIQVKTCTGCKETKPIDNFRKAQGYRFGVRSKCKTCESKFFRDYHSKHNQSYYKSPVYRDYLLRKEYGIGLDEYNILLTEQGNVCKVCKGTNGNGRHLSVDHDHKTGKVRGLLCDRCNMVIGKIDDNPDIAMEIYEYLKG